MRASNCFGRRKTFHGCNGLVFLVALGTLIPGIVLTAHAPALAQEWTGTGSLAVARTNQTATLLPSGKVLLAGGWDGTVLLTIPKSYKHSTVGVNQSGIFADSEIYDSSTGVWTETGPLADGRFLHTATLLPNGKVLVAAGADPNGFLSTSEMFDPSTGVWTATGSLATSRGGHTATLLTDGKVLVAAGGTGNAAVNDTSDYLPTCEIYDPTTGMWTDTGSLATERAFHTATLLAGGKVLAAGGLNASNQLADSEIYDPSTGVWTVTGSLATPRAFHTATLLPGGKVLVAGGGEPVQNNMLTGLSTCELYDPSTGVWTATGSLAVARLLHTATLLPNGKVLVAGGADVSNTLTDCEIYDPSTGLWTETGNLASGRAFHTATLLQSGKVLAAAGLSAFQNTVGVLSSAEIFGSSNTVPGAPTGVTATPGNAQATVSFTAPASDGGSPITGYTVTSNPVGGVDENAGTTSITHTVKSLKNGTAYTFTVTATNAIGTGPASRPSNSVTPGAVPGAPTNVTAKAGNSQATVSFKLPANGGSPITVCTATSKPGNVTGTGAGSPITVSGLTDGTGYTFTVTATNEIGTGPTSKPSGKVTPVGPPGAPTGVTATAGNAQAKVSFKAPASNGGSAITGYTVTSSEGQIAKGHASPITVKGLKNGTTYTFTVTATNKAGTGPVSSPSSPVTPEP
jgi:invasion protein IalB